jgi:predicted nucleic acid-binding protein
MNKLLIIGDTDGLIGYLNPADPHNKQALSTISFLAQHNAILAFPTTAIAEAVTTFQRKYSNPLLAQQIVEQYKAGHLLTIPIDDTSLQLALSLFDPHGSKQNTLFDAIVAATAKQQNADAIFSFDQWYTKLGLRLVSGILEGKEQAA